MSSLDDLNIEESRHFVVGLGAVGLAWSSILSSKCRVTGVVQGDFEPPAPSLEFSVKTTSGKLKAAVEVRPWEEIERFPEGSVIWIATKSIDLDSVLESIWSRRSPRSLIVLMSNGLGLSLQAGLVLKREVPILRCLINFGSRLTDKQEISLAGSPKVLLASFPEHNLTRDRIGDLLEALGVECTIEANIVSAEWKKALINLPINGLCTLVSAPNGALVEHESLNYLATQVLHETRTVAGAEGFDLSSIPDEFLWEACRAHATNRNSLLQDLERGSPSELEHLFGRFLRIARDHNVATPYSDCLYNLILALEQRTRAT